MVGFWLVIAYQGLFEVHVVYQGLGLCGLWGLQYFEEPLYLGNDRMKSRTLNGTSPSFEILRLFLHLSYLCLRAQPLEANRMIGD